jgi:hypothetical protein
MTEIKYQTNRDCGPHCGVKDKHVGHCKGCHERTCEASRYDRDKPKEK